MSAGDSLQLIDPRDQWIFDLQGNLVGIKNRRASGSDAAFLPATMIQSLLAAYIAAGNTFDPASGPVDIPAGTYPANSLGAFDQTASLYLTTMSDDAVSGTLFTPTGSNPNTATSGLLKRLPIGMLTGRTDLVPTPATSTGWGAGMGTSPPATNADGTVNGIQADSSDTLIHLKITTGSAPPTSSVVFGGLWGQTYTTKLPSLFGPFGGLTAGTGAPATSALSKNAANGATALSYSQITSTGWQLSTGATALAAATQYDLLLLALFGKV